MSLRKRTILFSAYCLVLVAASPHVWVEYLRFARENDSASHIVLIPLITITLIVQNRRAIFSGVASSWIPGSLTVLIGAVIWAGAATLRLSASSQIDSLTATVAASVILSIGGFLLFFGRQAFRSAMFPLLFLAFMVPIPRSLLDVAVDVLKNGSTEVVAVLFNLTGIPHYREGHVFSLPTVAIEIADECSGIRSSIALLITGLLAGNTFLKHSWSRVALVIAVLPLAILKNGIRIVSLSLLATYVDPSFLTGQLHNEGGILFFLLSLGLLIPVVRMLRLSETRLAQLSSVRA